MQLFVGKPECSVGMLAASTVQVSAVGVLPWQTPQSGADITSGT